MSQLSDWASRTAATLTDGEWKAIEIACDDDAGHGERWTKQECRALMDYVQSVVRGKPLTPSPLERMIARTKPTPPGGRP